MLIRFNLRNFLSFASREDGRTEEFSMLAGKVQKKKEHLLEDTKLKLLKFACVYGANASGKSNLVKAMDFMQKTILQGLPKGHTEQYCRMDPANKGKASYFEWELLLGGKYYSYGFEVLLSESRFLSEWLIELKKEGKDKVIFTRDILQGKYELGNLFREKGLKSKLKVYAEDITNDDSVLFLQVMNRNKKTLYEDFSSVKILKRVFDWVETGLVIRYPNRTVSDYSYHLEAKGLKELSQEISRFGTGIQDFELLPLSLTEVLERLPKSERETLLTEMEKHIAEKETFAIVLRTETDFFLVNIDKKQEVSCQSIQFSHGDKKILFRLEEESDGTIRLLDLLGILLSKEEKCYVIDELDRCLHPSLSYRFIQSFLEKLSKRRMQLIVTTHESRLLDFDLLRRDEIWFIDKKKSGESDIYSLEEYNERFDKKIDKAYLEGRYGGVPIFTTIFPIEKEED